MRTHIAFICLIFAIFLFFKPASAPATDFTVYHLSYQEEGTNEPVSMTETFSAANPNLSYTLNIQLASAGTVTVYLNGAQVVNPSEVNYIQNIAVLHKPVSLLAFNTIVVESPGVTTGTVEVVILGSTVHTNTFTATADNYIRSRNSNKNANYGSQLYLRIEDQNPSRALVNFTLSQIPSTLPPNAMVTSSFLQLYIESNFGNWGTSGRTVTAQPLSPPSSNPFWECEVPPNPPFLH